MIVKDLIAALSLMPQDAEVLCVMEGAARGGTDLCWLAKGYDDEPMVLLGDDEETIYYDTDRPFGAPTEKQEPFWEITGEWLKSRNPQS